MTFSRAGPYSARGVQRDHRRRRQETQLITDHLMGRRDEFFTAARAACNRHASKVARGGPASRVHRGRRRMLRSPRRAAVGPPATAAAPDLDDSRGEEWSSWTYRPRQSRGRAYLQLLAPPNPWRVYPVHLALQRPHPISQYRRGHWLDDLTLRGEGLWTIMIQWHTGGRVRQEGVENPPVGGITAVAVLLV